MMQQGQSAPFGGMFLVPVLSQAWQDDSHNRPLFFEAVPNLEVPEGWRAVWNGKMILLIFLSD
jgi:hypothetical protein